jgi:hypothetical protein
MGLQTDTVYKQTDDYYEKILSLQTFWIEPKDEWFNEKGLNNSQYIQYIPFKK